MREQRTITRYCRTDNKDECLAATKAEGYDAALRQINEGLWLVEGTKEVEVDKKVPWRCRHFGHDNRKLFSVDGDDVGISMEWLTFLKCRRCESLTINLTTRVPWSTPRTTVFSHTTLARLWMIAIKRTLGTETFARFNTDGTKTPADWLVWTDTMNQALRYLESVAVGNPTAPAGQDYWRPPEFCPKCGSMLQPETLTPVSYEQNGTINVPVYKLKCFNCVPKTLNEEKKE